MSDPRVCAREGCHRCIAVSAPKQRRYCSRRCQQRAWAARNRDRVNEQHREWARNHPEVSRRSSNRYNETHRDKVRAYARRHYAANAESERERRRERYRRQREEGR